MLVDDNARIDVTIAGSDVDAMLTYSAIDIPGLPASVSTGRVSVVDGRFAPSVRDGSMWRYRGGALPRERLLPARRRARVAGREYEPQRVARAKQVLERVPVEHVEKGVERRLQDKRQHARPRNPAGVLLAVDNWGRNGARGSI